METCRDQTERWTSGGFLQATPSASRGDQKQCPRTANVPLFPWRAYSFSHPAKGREAAVPETAPGALRGLRVGLQEAPPNPCWKVFGSLSVPQLLPLSDPQLLFFLPFFHSGEAHSPALRKKELECTCCWVCKNTNTTLRSVRSTAHVSPPKRKTEQTRKTSEGPKEDVKTKVEPGCPSTSGPPRNPCAALGEKSWPQGGGCHRYSSLDTQVVKP